MPGIDPRVCRVQGSPLPVGSLCVLDGSPNTMNTYLKNIVWGAGEIGQQVGVHHTCTHLTHRHPIRSFEPIENDP